MTLAASAAAALIAATSAPASAQDTQWYAGIGYTQFDADSVDVGGATARLGYRMAPFFGIEGEATFGIDEDTADFLGTPVDVSLDEQFGVYGVGFLPVSERADVFGRIGYVTIDASGSLGDFETGVDDDGLAYGVGAQWRMTDNFALRGDYTRLDADEEDVNTYGLSAIWMF